MIIKDLSISNFRGISKLKLEDFGDINLFVGNNNVGKTTVLEALFLITGMSNPALAINIDLFRNLVHTEGDDFRFIFHKLDYNNRPSFEANLYSKENRTLTIVPSLKYPGSDKIINASESSVNLDLVADSLTFDFSSKTPHSQRESQKATIKFTADGIVPTPPRSYKEHLSGIFIGHSQPFSAGDLTQRLETLIVAKKKDEVIAGLKLIDKNIRDISIGRNNMIYLDIEGINRLLPSNLEGSGLNRLIHLIVNLIFRQNSALYIDEIENGFHFHILKSVWNTLLKASKLYNVQIFATTHNSEVLKELHESRLDANERFQDLKIKAFSLLKNRESAIESVGYNQEQFDWAIEKQIEIR